MNIASWLLAYTLTAPDPCLMNALAQVSARGDGIYGRTEAAAFLVRDDDGSLEVVFWPRRENSLKETFLGTVPQGTIAIIHTHPPQMAQPSRQDIREAVRLNLPIYVVTVREIWLADPASGQAIQIGVRRLWMVDARSGCRAATAEPPPTITRASLRQR